MEVFEWNKPLSEPFNYFSGVTYGNNTYVAVGWSGRILTSPEGITWTEQISGTSEHLRRVTFKE